MHFSGFEPERGSTAKRNGRLGWRVWRDVRDSLGALMACTCSRFTHRLFETVEV